MLLALRRGAADLRWAQRHSCSPIRIVCRTWLNCWDSTHIRYRKSCMKSYSRTIRFLTSLLALAMLGPVQLDGAENNAELKTQVRRPNFLFILADDMCFDTINALGNSEIKTPNLDRLARAGTTFSNTYNMGGWNGAICVASRTMLNTGRFIWRAKATKFKPFVEEKKAWSQLLSEAGYETYMTGKWHVGGLKTGQIFDHVVHERPGMPNQTPEGYQRPVEGQPDQWSPYDPKSEGFWKGGKHWSEVLADDATQFLADAGKKDDPFFMYLAFNAPHDPRQSPKEFVDMYPYEEIAMPENFLPEYPYKEEIGCYRFPKGKDKQEYSYQRDEKLAPWPRSEYAIQIHRQEYYAIITHMDEQIGRIL